MSNDLRVLRERFAAIDGVIDRLKPEAPYGAARILLTVFDGGAMPSSGDHYFLGHPTTLDCAEVEASPCTPVVDADSEVAFVALHNAPQVGDIVPAVAAGGRWVASVIHSAATPCPCSTACSPVSMPSPALGEGPITLTFTPNPAWGGFTGGTPSNYGPYTLPASGAAWGINCPADGSNTGLPTYGTTPFTAGLSCVNGGLVFAWRLIDSCNPTTKECDFRYGGTSCSGLANSGCVPLTLIDSTANPFHLHFRPASSASVTQPWCDGNFPFTDVYLDAPAIPYSSPYFCVTVCAYCGVDFPDHSTITLSNASGYKQVQSTGTGSCATFNIGRAGTFDIKVENANFPEYTGTATINGCHAAVNLNPAGWACCGPGLLGQHPATSYSIPPSLTATTAYGTTPFNLNPATGYWEGCVSFDADDIITAIQFCGGSGSSSGAEYATIGSGKVTLSLRGLCTDLWSAFFPGAAPQPPGQFYVWAYWAVNGYMPIPPAGWACSTSSDGWFLVCAPCGDGGTCAYTGVFSPYGGGDCGGGGIPGGNASASLGATPDSLYPFAWSGTLANPTATWPGGSGPISCPVPSLGVSISA